MNKIEIAVQEAASAIAQEFSLECHAQLTAYATPDWERFVAANGFNKGLGLFIPTAMQGYVNRDAPGAVSSALHELFGHGLFCEHSHLGKKVVIAEKEGRLYEHLQRSIDNRVQRLGVGNTHWEDYEGFATWFEAMLCEKIGRVDDWYEKKQVLTNDTRLHRYLQMYNVFLTAEDRLSRFGLMGQMGFPLHYDGDQVVQVLRHLMGTGFNRIDFLILYGSRKPTSDIDVVMVGDLPRQEHYLGWLDISSHPRSEFGRRAHLLDISVTDPLFTGDVIYGDKGYVEQLKEVIRGVAITESMVQYNLQRAKSMAKLCDKVKDDPHEFALAESYKRTHQANAQLLTHGVKAMTKQAIEAYYRGK